MPLSPSSRLGPYEILAPLGAGGMGEVYRAKDTRLGREVAVKVLPEHLARNPEALARFEREAKAVAALSHPNILALYDVGADQGIHYAVTELLEGETLRARLGRSPLPWRRAVDTGIALADGLSAAHSKAIVHRDLKPENIFLTSDGRTKILDFGLARWTPPVSDAAATETEPGTVMGTLGYMSPEQVRGAPTDARTDIFSLGCVLYEMAAGRRAFASGSAADTMSAILNSDPPSLSDVPAELDQLVSHCLEKNLAQRFQSAGDLAFALRSVGTPRIGSRLRPALWIAAALAVLVAAVSLYWLVGRKEAVEALAVLPFVNVGGDPNTEYLSDGITENLINDLSRLPRLRVSARSVVFRYKGREADPQKAGRDLGVGVVLTGRVVQRGENLNIQADLMKVADASQLWGRQYERKFSDLIAVQEEIAREVSEKLRLRPVQAKRYTENTEAYQLYLKGRYYWNRGTGETVKRAVEHFQQAIDKDPNYALAWSGLAESYAVYDTYRVLPAQEAMPRAKEAARKAIDLDETLAEPHAALGYVKTYYDWDWPGAEKELKRALELNPLYATAHNWYSLYLESVGRPEEAVAASRRAQEIEPLSLIIMSVVGRHLVAARRYDQAIEQLRKVLDLDPNFGRAHWFLGLAYEQKAMYPEAIATFRKGLSLTGGEATILGSLGHAYGVSGNRAEAQKALAELLEQSKTRYVAPLDMGFVYLGLGDRDKALEWFEKGYEDHSSYIPAAAVDPRLDSIRGEPRFQNLLRRMGLKQ